MSALAFDPWAALEAHRQTVPPPNPPNAPNRGRPNAAGLGGLGGLGGGCILQAHVQPDWAAAPGVPPNWCEGVALLAAMPAPDVIPPDRWASLAAAAHRLLRNHGAELHVAGWDALDLFGLHATAPATNPAGWGLAWLIGTAGEMLDVAPDAVGMRRGPDGARLTFRRRCPAARVGVVLAWNVAAHARPVDV